MPVRFSVDSASRIVFTRAEGLVTLNDLQEHLRQEDAVENAAGYAEIFDASGATTDLTRDQVRVLVAQIVSMTRDGPFGPTAIITDNDTFFGMARMLEIICDVQGGPRFGVFRKFEDGLAWLREQSG